MTPRHIALVRSSFDLVAPIAPQAAAIFYDRLFAADPALRALFKGDMVHQGERLMAMIDGAVGLLDRPEVLGSTLQALGRRHVAYRVTEAHYATVGTALLQTLQDGLGEAFTPEVREAWAAMYGVVSKTMIEAAREAMPA